MGEMNCLQPNVVFNKKAAQIFLKSDGIPPCRSRRCRTTFFENEKSRSSYSGLYGSSDAENFLRLASNRILQCVRKW